MSLALKFCAPCRKEILALLLGGMPKNPSHQLKLTRKKKNTGQRKLSLNVLLREPCFSSSSLIVG